MSLLAHRFREVVLNGRWIANTNFKEQLSDVDLHQATVAIGGINTIAMLTYHIHYYIKGILQVFEGGTLDIRDKFSFDMPELKDDHAWENLKQNLWADAEKFAVHIENLNEQELLLDFVDPKYGNYLRNIDGMIEHCYYHLGQIVLLKKINMILKISSD